MTGLLPVGLRTQTRLGPRPIQSWVDGPWECRSPIRTVFINKAVGNRDGTREGLI
jgi:hypothetical protein